MVQLYIKHTDDNYYLLDIEDAEAINFKNTAKDLSDITKIFAPFTQSFSIKATDKNKILCGFVGNEKIQRVNNSGEFDAMIYISGFLFQSGKLSFDESDYELQDQKTFKTNFASNLTSLVDKLGDSIIQDLFQDESGEFDPLVKVDWNVLNLKDLLWSTTAKTLANGIEFKYGIPFISNNRVWTYDPLNLDAVDNIAYKQTRTESTVNQIMLSEVRPAINYMSVMKHLLLKIGSPVICPILDRPEVKDLFIWCSSESLVVPNAVAFTLVNYNAITYSRYNDGQDIGGVPIPSTPRWIVTGGDASGIFKIERNESADEPNSWNDGFDLNVTFNNIVSLDASDIKVKVVLRNATTGIPIDIQEITGASGTPPKSTYTFRILDPVSGTGHLDINGELYFKIEILPTSLVKWTNLEVKTVQKFYRSVSLFPFGHAVTRATFSYTAVNNTPSSSLGGNMLNMVASLPKMKCIDFLRSFFKTFNISVISTGLNDQSMYWLTPSDIQENNKPYSKRIVDYTPYTNKATLTKKKGSQYNQYSFSHFASKYYESVYGDGTRFGELVYPLVPPANSTKFEVKTDYSIIKQAVTFNHPSSAKTCLGFIKDNPTVLDNGGNRYKPVYDEFTIFYLKSRGLGSSTISVEYNTTTNAKLLGLMEATFKNQNNGKTLGFGAVDLDTDSLYLNYYKTFIELLLTPNTYSSEFNLTLPPNEIFLNFANLNQGESNIPTGFRIQNEIIIGEQRYFLLDSGIDLTTGKAKITALNF